MGLFPNDLTVHDIESFLLDMVQRFAPDNELEDVLGPVCQRFAISWMSIQTRRIAATVFAMARRHWRVGGVSDTQIDCVYDTCMEEWVPMDAGAADFETNL